ncbi:Acyl-coenzyme A synthetase ACSM2, mitochondrial [Microtus ochrogaster]|uniref:Acyl-coenzyme A synthetase ACSM2, mitochondrial n=1 Tax=Microtus ochrogaster TaxID=79684 RepID=A0A8J6GAF0_MICOH|nr:Acyl-coenzyme A synthetase ACSM2, mitochondrial [Microtus ochrogaster]
MTGPNYHLHGETEALQPGHSYIALFPKHGPHAFLMCSHNNPKKTEANIRGDFWLLGDRGIKDPEGYFYFLARTDDIINSSGYRIGPSEVENALMEHPAVAETAVVSSPDPSRGEVVKAFVVLAPEFLSHDPDQLTKLLQQHVKSVTAPYKYPRKVEFVSNLPKTITGKINRAKLRTEEWKTSRQGQAQ